MPEIRLRMDPLNPGQFFACCGLLELFGLEHQHPVGWFEISDQQPRRAYFLVRHPTVSLPLETVTERLSQAKPQYDNDVEAKLRPVSLPYGATIFTLDWWLDKFRQSTVALKCWGGQVTTKILFSELLPLVGQAGAAEDLFHYARMTKAKFGIDPRSAWNALDFGFSPNEHGRDSAIFPAVEILAAVGLQTFRPDIRSREDIRYSLWGTPLTVAVARQAFRSPWDGLPRWSYSFAIRKRGQGYKYFTFGNDLQQES